MNAPQTMTDRLLAEKKDGIGWIAFNNPARHNAVSFEMWQALPVVLANFAADPEVGVIVLKGAAAAIPAAVEAVIAELRRFGVEPEREAAPVEAKEEWWTAP